MNNLRRFVMRLMNGMTEIRIYSKEELWESRLSYEEIDYSNPTI